MYNTVLLREHLSQNRTSRVVRLVATYSMQPAAIGLFGSRDDVPQRASRLGYLQPAGLGVSRAQAYLVVPQCGQFRRNLPALCNFGLADLFNGQRAQVTASSLYSFLYALCVEGLASSRNKTRTGVERQCRAMYVVQVSSFRFDRKGARENARTFYFSAAGTKKRTIGSPPSPSFVFCRLDFSHLAGKYVSRRWYTTQSCCTYDDGSVVADFSRGAQADGSVQRVVTSKGLMGVEGNKYPGRLSSQSSPITITKQNG